MNTLLNKINLYMYIHAQRARPVDTISTTGKKLANQLNTLLIFSKEKKLKNQPNPNTSEKPTHSNFIGR